MTPIQYFETVWQRCDQLSAMQAYLATNCTALLKSDEILRAELVARVAALDLYMHELVAQKMLEVFMGTRPRPGGYDKFNIPMETMDRIRGAASRTDAASAFDLEVRRQLGVRTYQAPEDIADGFRLISNLPLWNTVAQHQGATGRIEDAAKASKRRLAAIVGRRNKIAHEGDLQPGQLRVPLPISQADLKDVANFLEALVRSIDACV